jgi:hypothetical protein
MPLRLRQDPRGSMNLIPVNYFVEAFRALHEDATQGGIFNLACPEPVSLDTLVRFTSEKFAIEGVVTRDDDGPGPASNPLEAMFESYIEAYRHYMLDRRLFATDRALSYLRSRNVVCPRFSYDVFSRCMDYAVAVDWGKNIEGGP